MQSPMSKLHQPAELVLLSLPFRSQPRRRTGPKPNPRGDGVHNCAFILKNVSRIGQLWATSRLFWGAFRWFYSGDREPGGGISCATGTAATARASLECADPFAAQLDSTFFRRLRWSGQEFAKTRRAWA